MSLAKFSLRPRSLCDRQCSGPCQRCQKLNLNCQVHDPTWSQSQAAPRPLGASPTDAPMPDRNVDYVPASISLSSGFSQQPNILCSPDSSHLLLDVQSLQAYTPPEDAVNISPPREFSDDEWNDIFMRSETGNCLAFPAPGEALNMVHAQENSGMLEPATASRQELHNRTQKEQGPNPLEPIMENTELHEANNYKRFSCLFQHCNRASSVQGFPSKRHCYRHMKDTHRFADGFDVYLKLIDRQELMDMQAQ